MQGDVVQPRMEIIQVTPEVAQELLGRNTRNRAISRQTVLKYAHDMGTKKWRDLTPEPLAVDRNGVLQQGQHRLLAVIESGVTVTFWIAWDTDPDDFAVLDQGKKRSAADVLGMKGFTQTRNVSTIGRLVLLHQHFADVRWTGTLPVTTADVIEFCDANKDVLGWAANSAQVAWRGCRVPISQYGAVATIVAMQSDSLGLWERWHRDVTEGTMLAADNPAFALRRWAVGPAALARAGSGQQQMRQSIITKAWNAYVEDRSMKIVYWRKSELPMPWPKRSMEVEQ